MSGFAERRQKTARIEQIDLTDPGLPEQARAD
jgi:hypothetical protein